MWPDLSKLTVAPLDLVVRAVVVYLSVLLLLRAGGKKQLGQMGATEFVAVLLISNAVQNSMNGGDNSLTGGLLLAATLVALSWGISVLTFHSKTWRVIFEGSPTLLIHKGQVLPRNLLKERLTQNELKILLRKQGIHSLHEIYTAILESDGSLSVTKVSEVENTK